MQIWVIDENGFYKNESKIIAEEEYTNLMTTVPLTVGYVKPQLVNNQWIEGATQEEIEAWKEANNKPNEPDEVETLTARVDGLENINAGLLLENAEQQIKIQGQEKMNKEQEVTNANLLLEIAMLKGAMV